MSEATYVELPWRIIGRNQLAIVGPKWPKEIGHFICSIHTNDGVANRATAEFILRVVNYHGRLVDAAKNALCNIEIHEAHSGRTGRFEPLKHQLRSVLSAIEADSKTPTRKENPHVKSSARRAHPRGRAR